MTKSVTSLKIQDCCNASAVLAAMTPDTKQAVVGGIFGKAVDFITRANPSGGEPFTGFAGLFEITPAIRDESKGGISEDMRANNLFLPDAFRDVLAEKLSSVLYPNADKPEKKARGASVTFAAKILLVRADNKAGYAWGLEVVQEPEADDPLADMRERHFPSKKADPAQAEATPAAGKGKGK